MVSKVGVPFAKKECCGCTVCYDICPTSAISIETDEEGFVYPQINNEKCVQCGLCTKVCAFSNKAIQRENDKLPSSYVMKHSNQNVRMNSTSGAVFVAVSDYILDNDGSVYGCVLDEKFQAVHIRAENRETRNLMCRSKYVQSNTKGIFSQVEKDLNENKMVLFSGTGCQIDSLYSYLNYKKTDLSKLYTMDLICHGVPSPRIYEDFLRWTERRYKGEITEFLFRDKIERGWDSHYESAVINNRKYVTGIYRELFYTNCSLRPSCYNCKYTSTKRCSDITIADALGIKNKLPHFYDSTGVSLVLINNDKGQEIFNKIKNNCFVEKVSLELMMQPNLKKASQPKKDREEFWRLYEQGGIELLIKKYAPYSLVNKVFRRINFIIKKKKIRIERLNKKYNE